MTNPSLNNGPKLLKVKTKDEDFIHLMYKTEKRDLKNILKSLKFDKDF